MNFTLLDWSAIVAYLLITLLLGLNSSLAAVAAVFHTMNHATFKASLFMSVGIIDHETGTRDMRRLDGLFRLMPITATLAMVACAAGRTRRSPDRARPARRGRDSLRRAGRGRRSRPCRCLPAG